MKKTLMSMLVLSVIMLFSTVALADVDNSYGGTSSGSTSGSVSDANIGDVGSTSIIGDVGSGNTSNYEATKTKRFFLNPGEMNYPMTPGRFDAPPERFGYMNALQLKDLMMYEEDGGITTAEAIQMAKGVGGKRVMVRAKYGAVPKDERMDKDVAMPVFESKVKDARSLGVIVIVSDSKKAISADVFAQAQIEAWKLGGTALHVKFQGFQREVHTSGKGIGFSWTGTTISGGQTSATTGVFGFGASWGQAGYYDHPFIIVHVLVAK